MGYGPFGPVFDEGQKIFDPGDALGMQREKDAAAELQRRYEQMRADYEKFRPEAMQGRTNALNQQLGAFKPINDLLSRMYGPGAAFDLNAIGRNPMSYGMPQPQGAAAPPAGQSGGGSNLLDDIFGGLPSPDGSATGVLGGLVGAGTGGLVAGPLGYAAGAYGGNQLGGELDRLLSGDPRPLDPNDPNQTFGAGSLTPEQLAERERRRKAQEAAGANRYGFDHRGNPGASSGLPTGRGGR